VNIDLKNGVYHLAGRVDEYAEFERFANAPAPLKLDLGKITAINSVGVRKFLAFALAWTPRKFEFFACTPEFIANVNVIPQMLGSPSDPTQIKSLFVPFACENCKRVENVLIQRDGLEVDGGGDVILASQTCAKCGNPLDLDVEPTEYFTFLRGD
jgi:hypothetical protein